MRAFAMLKIGQTGWIEKERPGCGMLDAVVKPLALAPCTSDIHTVYEGALGQRHNLVLGHEAVGEIVEVGGEVKDFKAGDKVIVPAITPNWRTHAIEEGVPPQHSEGMLSGWKFSNIKDGVFSEFFHVNDADMNLALIPEGMTLPQAVMLPDMVTTGFHGVELAKVEFGSTVAVIGIGPVGLMCVAGAALRGAARLFAVGSRPLCAETARQYGATDIINYKNGDIVEQIMDATGGHGADHVIVAGGPSEVLEQAVRICKPGGVIGNVNYFGEGEFLRIPREAWGVGMSHKQINGGLTPGGRVRMERMAALVMHQRFDPGKLVTHTFHGLQHLEDGLELMHHKPADIIKPVILI
ncbi:MAG: NADP-dependent isopropanol dehydrogenase [Lentisphaerae bacterium ADurb.Bin242]|nr:MAG: NADP-dependent isopropanol dehydrogenase [Lentisphaerae bacterium ADurb.Bin242]